MHVGICMVCVLYKHKKLVYLDRNNKLDANEQQLMLHLGSIWTEHLHSCAVWCSISRQLKHSLYSVVHVGNLNINLYILAAGVKLSLKHQNTKMCIQLNNKLAAEHVHEHILIFFLFLFFYNPGKKCFPHKHFHFIFEKHRGGSYMDT